MGLEIRVGMTADEVLKAIRRAGIEATKAPEIVGEDENGRIVRWFLPGQELTLRREKYVAPYTVAAIASV